MNDQNEITYAIVDVLSPLLAEHDDDGHPKYYLRGVKAAETVKAVWATWCTHIASFSANSALPSQWNSYAGATGCAIGFDRRALQDWCLQKHISLFPMNYELPRQREMIREFLAGERSIELSRLSSRGVSYEMVHELRGHANKYLCSLMQSMKSEEWGKEQEWRVFVLQKKGQERFEPFNRPDGVCCFELPICTAAIVKEIVLAPHCTFDSNGVRSLLNDVGLGSALIRRVGQ